MRKKGRTPGSTYSVGYGRPPTSSQFQRGHSGNPMTDEEVSDKFRMLAERKLDKRQAERALKVMWAFDTATGLDALFESVHIGR